MKKHTSLFKRIASFSFAAVSCASLMLAPVNGITTPLQNFCITASAGSNQVNKDTLVLSTGQSAYSSSGSTKIWYSKNKRYQLALMPNGNLILKDVSGNRTVWSSNTKGNSTNTYRFVMQGDGNLVLYSQPRNSRNVTAIWNSQTVIKGNNNKYSVRLSDDGELYVYSEKINQSIWSSRSEITCTATSNTYLYASQCLSSKNRLYRAVMQADGNFVIYRKNNGSETATWHTHTDRHNNAFLALQQDGNLVVYATKSKALFYTGTDSTPYNAYKLTLGDDGVLRLSRIEGKTQREIWNSRNGKNKVEAMLTWAINTANDNSHGYSQENRLGPDYDCSSFVSTAAHQAGFNVAPDLTTYSMQANFKAAGFQWIAWEDIKGTSDLKRGDILLRINDSYINGRKVSAHTELYLGNSILVGARGRQYYSRADQISEHDFQYRTDYWDGVLRYNG